MRKLRKSNRGVVVNFVKRTRSNKIQNSNSNSTEEKKKKIINKSLDKLIDKSLDSSPSKEELEELNDITMNSIGETNRQLKNLEQKMNFAKKVTGKWSKRRVNKRNKKLAKKQYKKHGIKVSKKKIRANKIGKKMLLKNITNKQVLKQLPKEALKLLGKLSIKVLASPTAWIIIGVIVGGLLLVNVVSGATTMLISSTNTIFAEREDVEGYQKIIDKINKEYIDKINKYKEKYDEVEIITGGETGGSSCGWKEVLVITAVKYEQELPKAQSIEKELRDLFAKFNKMETQEEEYEEEQEDGSKITKKKLIITLENPNLETVLDGLKFTKDQKEWVYSLQNADLKETFPNINFDSNFFGPTTGNVPTLTPEEIEELMKNMPTTTVTRKKLITTAASLEGKVSYFWGGKSSCTGWNPMWGKPALVTAPGSRTTGTYRPYGLDCSGFVDWVYRTAGVGSMFQGGGTNFQFANSYAISESQLEPGDLVFDVGLTHVGLFFGYDSYGNKLYIHCASGSNTVVINSYSGFTLYRKPFVKF